jgi:hypothetical protein
MTMHTFDSVQKLLPEWENPAITDPFIYKEFAFKNEEYDNVPAVVPRFQFYL